MLCPLLKITGDVIHTFFPPPLTPCFATSNSHQRRSVILSVSPETLRSRHLFLAYTILFLPDMLVSQFHHNAEVLLAQSAAVVVTHHICGRRSKSDSRYGSASQPCCRRTVSDVYSCLGDLYFKCAYRMSYRSL